MTRSTRAAPLDMADAVAAIVDTYHRAEPADILAGRQWYPTAGRIADVIASACDPCALHDSQRVAFTMAALSPRNPWRWNVADAYAFTMAAHHGGEMPTATTFGSNARTAWDIARGIGDAGNPWSTAALKVRRFVSAILGDTSAVVVDVWAVRIATRGRVDAVRSDAHYREVADAYWYAAREVGEYPRDLQAITWLVAQREGLGSKRRGRHDTTWKAGTAAEVVDIMERCQ